MKLEEFLKDFFETTGPTGDPIILDSYILTNEHLKIKSIQEKLLDCEEFEHTKELVIMDKPFIDIDDKMKSAVTMSMSEGIKFGEKVCLHSIFLSPVIYEPSNLTKPVKDNITVLPTVMTESFTPLKGITVFWNPEQKQDDSARGKTEDEIKEEMIEKFKKALDNPKEYEVTPRRGVMIRGVYDVKNVSEINTALVKGTNKKMFVTLK